MAKTTTKRTKTASTKTTSKANASAPKQQTAGAKTKATKNNIPSDGDLNGSGAIWLSRKLVLLLLALFLALVVGGVFFWWNKFWLAKDRVFWGAIKNSLSTSGFKRTFSQDSTQGKLSQESTVDLVNSKLEGTVTVEQDAGSSTTSKVVSEILGDRNSDYARYTEINTSLTSADSLKEVINKWAKREGEETQFVADSISNSVVIVANLKPDQQDEIYKQIVDSKSYSVDTSKANSEIHEGKGVYVYDVSINVKALTEVLKKMLETTGFSAYADKLNPATANGVVSKAKIAIYKSSHRPAYVKLLDTSDGSTEEFKDFGPQTIKGFPSDTVSFDELTSLLVKSAQN